MIDTITMHTEDRSCWQTLDLLGATEIKLKALGIPLEFLCGDATVSSAKEAETRHVLEMHRLRQTADSAERVFVTALLRDFRRCAYRRRCRVFTPIMYRVLRTVRARQTAYNRKRNRALANRPSRSKKR